MQFLFKSGCWVFSGLFHSENSWEWIVRVSLPLSTLSIIWQPLRQVTHTKLLQTQYFFTKMGNPHVNWRGISNTRGTILQYRAYINVFSLLLIEKLIAQKWLKQIQGRNSLSSAKSWRIIFHYLFKLQHGCYPAQCQNRELSW